MLRSAFGSRTVGSVRQMIEEDDGADRHVDVEDPLPAEVVGDQAAEPGAEQRAEAEDGAEEALVLAALGWSEDVADDGQRDREERAGTQALQPAEGDQLPHLLREPRQHRPDQEDQDADDEDRPPAEEVGELAVDRPADRRRHQVGGERPDVDVVAVQVGDDDRQRGPDDGLVEGGEEDAQQDSPENLEADAVRKLDRCSILVGRGWS